jgi:hypothetical protein
MVGRFAGTITFTDGTIEVFHTQGEWDVNGISRAWSIDENESKEALKQVNWHLNPNYPPDGPQYPYKTGVDLFNIMNGLFPFAGCVWANTHPAAQKIISDMTSRLDLTLARDDNKTYQVAAVIYKFPNVILEGLPFATHPPQSLVSVSSVADRSSMTDATNLAAVKVLIRTAFNVIMETVTVS